MPNMNSEQPRKPKRVLMYIYIRVYSYSKKSLDLSQNLAKSITPASNSEQSRTSKHLLLPVLNSDQPRKSKYLLMGKSATAVNSTDRYSRLRIYFSAGNFHGPSSLWMFYRIVSEAVRKKDKTLNKSSLIVNDFTFFNST